MAGVCSPVRATELSKNLSATEIKDDAAILGFGAMHRPYTAHSLPSGDLGLDFGLESAFIFRREMLSQGDGAAVVPNIVPVPRLWLSWEFPYDLTFSGTFAPGFMFDGVTQYGLGLQWFYYEYSELKTAITFVGHYSFADAFGDLTTNTYGVDMQASRDLQIWQPYAGVGLLFQRAAVRNGLAAAGVSAGSYNQVRPHLFLGGRVDLITKLSFQIDICGTLTSAGLLFENSF